jgi:starch-binding outer membrane protein, SusD/RagB family
MRINKKLTLVGLLLFAGGVAGCDDFLEGASAPQGALDDLTLANRAGLEGTLIGAYRMVGGHWDNFASAPSNWALSSVTSDDAYKGTEPSDQPAINPLEIYQWNVDFGYPNQKWAAVYEGVSRANSTLRLLQRVEGMAGELTPELARSIRGEALFLRAHYHFEAYRVFKNVPVYTEEDTDFRKANVPGPQVLAAILKDLDDAIALLPNAPRNAQKGRASVWTARAYKGRVQMYARDFANALTTLRQVQQQGPYGLEESFDQVWTARAQFTNGRETIWAFQASVNDGEGEGRNSNWGERLNFPHSGSPFGCCGFHQPSQNLVNVYRVDANGLPLAMTTTDGNPAQPLNAQNPWNRFNETFVAGNMAPVDPRLDWTVGRDGVPYKDYAVVHAPNWIRQAEYGGPYSPKKHIHEKASGLQSTVGWNAQHLNGTNIHIFRYADLLLMIAEAEVEVGSLENARTIVNQIRARAGQRAQGPGTTIANMAVPLNDPSITWATYRIGQYNTPWTNRDVARQAVRLERRLELAFEGQRLFDLQRWNEHAPVLNNYIAVEKNRRPHLQAAIQVADRHLAYPIPPTQIDLSRVGGEERLTQNPGW